MNKSLYIVHLDNYSKYNKKNILESFYLDIIKKIINFFLITKPVTHLSLGHSFNQSLKEGDIPNSVTHLRPLKSQKSQIR